jgi:hypothetical protein
VQVVLVAQHTFVTSDPWTATMVGSEVAEDSLLEVGKTTFGGLPSGEIQLGQLENPPYA